MERSNNALGAHTAAGEEDDDAISSGRIKRCERGPWGRRDGVGIVFFCKGAHNL
jgi:hypothetical protein